MKRFIASTLLLFASLAQAADPALERQVMDLLNAYEAGPTAQELQALGTGVDEILRTVATDDHRVVAERARALVCLGWFPTDENHALLSARAQDASQPSILRRKAVAAIATGWPTAASAELTPLFADTDVQLRIALVNAFARLPAESARPVLETRLAAESNDAVRKALQDALK